MAIVLHVLGEVVAMGTQDQRHDAFEADLLVEGPFFAMHRTSGSADKTITVLFLDKHVFAVRESIQDIANLTRAAQLEAEAAHK